MNFRKSLLLLLVPLFLSACTSYKKSLYLRHDEVLEMVPQKGKLYEYRIMPKDELTILVSTSAPEASAPFYRKIGQTKDQPAMNQNTNDAKLLEYLVDNNGCIDFPVLGMIKVVGLTNRECEEVLRQKLRHYLNEDPNVTVRTSNFKISVLGEVGRPGTYTISDEKVTIFQALAEAGDMTLFSVRNDVQLLREDSVGKRRVIHLDLTAADISLSPYYYLQQNDVVYVKPTKAKVRSNTFSNNTTVWTSLISLAATIASLIIVSIR